MNSDDIKAKLAKRRSMQKVLQDRLNLAANRELVNPANLPLLGISEVTIESLWLLNRILVDAHETDLQEHLKKSLSADDLVPCLIDLTPQNYEWMREIHQTTLQSLSYIINRLIESCRYDVPWEIKECAPEEVVRALELVQKYEYSRQAIHQSKGVARRYAKARKEVTPVARYGDDRAKVDVGRRDNGGDHS